MPASELKSLTKSQGIEGRIGFPIDLPIAEPAGESGGARKPGWLDA